MKKRKIVILMCIVFVSLWGMAARVPAKEIVINNDNFPGSSVRSFAEKKDLNGDGILQQSEIDKVTDVMLYTFELFDPEEMEVLSREVTNEYQDVDCRGLQFFTKIKNIDIQCGTIKRKNGKEKPAKVTYLEKLFELPKVKKINIIGAIPQRKVIVSNKTLESLCLNGWDATNTKLEKVVITKRSKNLKKLYIMKCRKVKSLELTRAKNLEKLYVYDAYNLKKLVLSKTNKKIKTVVICAEEKRGNKRLKRLDLSGYSSLRKVEFNNFKNLSSLKLPKKIKKKNVRRYGCRKLKIKYV